MTFESEYKTTFDIREILPDKQFFTRLLYIIIQINNNMKEF